jgi:hypothetical protein
MGVGVFHEPLNFEHTYVTCKFVGVLVGFCAKPPFYDFGPSALLLGLFVVCVCVFFLEVITKLFMVAKKCELCPPLGVYVVACVCVILFWVL